AIKMSKRQFNLLSFFKRKEENDDAKRTRSETTIQEGGCGTEQVQDATGAVNEQEAITSCYPWLVMYKSRLGCTTCKAVGSLGPEKTGGMKLAKEWIMCTVTSSASDIKKQQPTLRKKVFEYARAKAHLAAADILEKAKGDTIVQAIVNSQSEQITTTARVFRTAYKEAKRHRPAYGFEQELDCQVLNGIDMGRILHSNVACSNIQKHISEEMKRKLFEKMVQCAPKLSLMLDESTSLNKKSALIIYVRFKLDDPNAEGIVRHLLSALERLNLIDEFLSKTLIGVTCDGTSVMLGRTSGVASRLRDIFPNITVWHCSVHRLELAIGDVVKEIGTINYFKILMDKLYAIYSASNKNRMELKDAAESLDVQLCKIGRILDTRWVASSFRTVETVWKKLPTLIFLCVCKQPLALCVMQFLGKSGYLRQWLKGQGYTELSQRGIDANSFQGVPLHEGKLRYKTLNQRLFFSSLAKNMEERMLSQVGRLPDKTGYNKFIEELKVLYAQYWPENTGATYGETEVESLCWRFDIDSPCAFIRAYREYRDSDGKCIPDQLKELFAAVNSIYISSAECERGFSQMNLICSPNRASLHTSTISYLPFLNLVGPPPLSKFDPVPYVRSWIAKRHITATDIRSKTRNREEENHDMALVWGVLDN
uniref:HAT C-terminal dimerisation domain-containing protein n=1 Tax=Sinocyclocheilus grahami TaxID=75366 RepID=A0A672RKS2_SINGR